MGVNLKNIIFLNNSNSKMSFNNNATAEVSLLFFRYFLRVAVFNTFDTILDETTLVGDSMSDIYVKGWLEGAEHDRQKTDVHYRCMDGHGMFNWRFVFEFDYDPSERKIVVKRKASLIFCEFSFLELYSRTYRKTLNYAISIFEVPNNVFAVAIFHEDERRSRRS